MKLRNKKTGEILTDNEAMAEMLSYNSLAELNEDWGDYVEKKTYVILANGLIKSNDVDDDIHYEERLEIGNCFETREEAELAVDKLKAWKRLKEAGFKFNGWEESVHEDANIVYFTMPEGISIEDLDLLFSQEDDGEYD